MKTSVPGTPNVCYNCGEPSHYANYCPKKRNQQTPQKQNSHQKPAPNTGRVNHVSAETASVEPKVMLGTFDVHSTPFTILFYSRASHTFISQNFVKTHSIPLCAMKNPIIVNSPRGIIPASYCCLPTSLILRGVEFKVTPIVLRTARIDLILGMDWMMQQEAKIQCKEKAVELTSPMGGRIKVEVVVQKQQTTTVNQLDEEASN
jgi:hypothetical protein